MTNEQIALEHMTEPFGNLAGMIAAQPYVLAMIAAARADQHAECVRLLREDLGFGYAFAADWLESHKP